MAQSAAFKKELEQLKREHEKIIRKQSDLEKQMQQEQAAHAQTVLHLKQHEADALERQKEQLQIAQEKAVLQVEKSYQKQIQKLMAEKQAEADRYQQKYFSLMEQIQNSQVKETEDENA